MGGRVRNVSGYRRQLLAQGWEMCAAPAGAFDSPAALPASGLTWIPFQAPGTVASGLRAAGLWSLDGAARRFDAEDWWFRTRFATPGIESDEILVLGFDGLATVADVWLNGEALLVSDNMFVAHEKHLESRPDHELVIRFRSLDTLLSARRPRPRWKAPMIENQQLRWFRTTVLGRTPGWSPSAAAVGPWRAVWVESRSRVTVDRVAIESSVVDAKGIINAQIGLSALRNTDSTALDARIDLVVSRGGDRWMNSLSRLDAQGTYSGSVAIDSPRLWWPHTHGDPALYELALHIRLADDDPAPVVIDLGKTGFRTLRLDQTGGSFGLELNGVRVFCRGACWTPLDVVTLGGGPAAYRSALEQVRDAGMNMLRVGGTMVYESDDFLDLCDAMGILLWQDFMFANMDYPEEDPAFLDSAQREARQQLERLAGRPSVAVLCGNSEVEQQAAMWGAPRERWSPPLFHKVLPEIAQSVCPDVPYWPSSAHGGSFPHQPNSGTTSYYGVGAYLRPAEDARRSELRFATECLGFANVPEDSCITRMPGGLALRVHHPQWKARSPRDLGAGWDFDDVRDFYLESLFRVDARQLRYADHDRYLELSRVVPGEVMASAFAEWRSSKSNCNGALVWFLKDLWAGAGWGVIDSDQQPKAAYYYLRRALQPVTVTINDEGVNGVAIHLVNERSADVEGTLELSLYRDGEVLIGSTSRCVRIPSRQDVQMAALDLFDAFSDLSYAYRFGPPTCNVIMARLLNLNEGDFTEAFFFPAGMNLPHLGEVGLTAIAKLQANGDALLTLKAARFAQSVTIAAAGYLAEDQYFHLAPQRERVIRLRPLRDSVKLKGTIKALNSKAVTKIEILE